MPTKATEVMYRRSSKHLVLMDDDAFLQTLEKQAEAEDEHDREFHRLFEYEMDDEVNQ